MAQWAKERRKPVKVQRAGSAVPEHGLERKASLVSMAPSETSIATRVGKNKEEEKQVLQVCPNLIEFS